MSLSAVALASGLPLDMVSKWVSEIEPSARNRTLSGAVPRFAVYGCSWPGTDGGLHSSALAHTGAARRDPAAAFALYCPQRVVLVLARPRQRVITAGIIRVL